MDSETASDLLYFAAELAPNCWKARRDNSLPLSYDSLVNTAGEVVFGVPVKPERVNGGYGINYRRRCCESATGAVVRLRLQMEEDGGLDDLEAVSTLDALLEVCGYSGTDLKVSVVFLLEGLENQPDAVELFRRECPQLIRLIQYDFAGSYFVANPYGCDRHGAVRAVEWLSGRIDCLNTGK